MKQGCTRIVLYIFGDKTTIWRTCYIETSEDTEQGIIIQMHSIQHPQTDQSYYDIECFLDDSQKAKYWFTVIANWLTYNAVRDGLLYCPYGCMVGGFIDRISVASMESCKELNLAKGQSTVDVLSML